jgi:G3E family GTPase
MQGINSAAEIIETVRAQADLDRILGIGAFSLDRILEEEPDFLDVRGGGT